MTPARATLFVIPGSHPSMTARLMLELKGIDYRRIDLVPVVSRGVLRAARFPGVTVPALKIDGRRIQGSRAIARALDELRPDPPLLPSDPQRRAAVEEAERWGDEVLQPVARRLTWWAFGRDRSTMVTVLEGAKLGVPTSLAVWTAPPIISLAARLNRADDAAVRADLEALPGMLDRVDVLIDEGVLDGDLPNAADFQLATSVRLLMAFDDFRPAIEGRPLGRHALRIVPSFPGRIPSVLAPHERPPALVPAS